MEKIQNKLFAAIIILLFAIVDTTYSQTAAAPTEGDGSAGNPYQITTLENLYWITAHDSIVAQPNQATRQSSHYIQTANIDASPTLNWFSNGLGGFQGWIPIINFSGSYNGNSNSITGLYINWSIGSLGLFGTVTEAGSIKNLGLVDAEITSTNPNTFQLGALVGFCFGTIDNSFAIVNNNGGLRSGGLVGELYFNGLITNSYSEGTVIGSGGLVGLNRGVIHNSHSSANVTGNGAGGLVGSNSDGFISHCYATGNVTESGISSSIGGLVGNNSSVINYSYATGNVSTVSGTGTAGGLVGENTKIIKNSFATGNVTGSNNAGGFAGRNISYSASAIIENCYALGSVTSNYSHWDMVAGGFVGINHGINHSGRIINSYSRGNVYRNHEYPVTMFGGFAGKNGGIIINSFSTSSVAYYNASNPTNKGFVGEIDTVYNYYMSGNYWNMETSFQSTSAGNAEGRTTSQMTSPYSSNTYVGWNFNQIWAEDQNYTHNNGYPYIFVRDTVSAPLAGDGTESNPFQIASFENLLWVSSSDDIVAFPPQKIRWKSHYKQVADIDASESSNWTTGFEPIGNYSQNNQIKFTGGYDGDNHSINNLFINKTDLSYHGLFGYIEDAIIKNLNITNIEITGKQQTGGLVGNAHNSIIENVNVSGSVTGTLYTGGIVGYMTGGTGIISQSTFNGTVTGTDQVGGLLGVLTYNNKLSYSYSLGNVIGNSNVGGVIGNCSGIINDCYSRASVEAVVAGPIGGLVGNLSGNSSTSLTNSFSTGTVNSSHSSTGGLIGYFYGGSAVNSYWDTETSGKPTSAGGAGVMGRLTSEMTFPFGENTYTDWNFSYVWGIDSSSTINSGYPYIYLRDTTTNISDIDEQPLEFSLSQNYPNPFNPSTVISYQLPVFSKVVLKVYDILGNEITTLINEYKSPGKYEVQFDAANLPSGVYFYQLTNGAFSNTKKLILLK